MSKVSLTFDTEIAKDYGVNAAIILQNIEFWQHKNEANSHNFHEGKYWIYNSNTAWAKLFCFLSTRQIRTALSKLEKDEVLVSGIFNKDSRDRTKWYSSNRFNQVLPKSQKQITEIENGTDESDNTDKTKTSDGTDESDQPLPVIKPSIIKPSIIKQKEKVFNFRKELIILGLKEELASDWLKVRKNRKATNTETAFNRFVKEFEKCELGINEIVEICIVKNWAGFENKWLLNLRKNKDSTGSNNFVHKPGNSTPL